MWEYACTVSSQAVLGGGNAAGKYDICYYGDKVLQT